MTTFIVWLMAALLFVMMVGKVGACLASFTLSNMRGNMKDEHRKYASMSDVVHGINDLSQAAGLLALIVFVLSKIATMYGRYDLIYIVSDVMLMAAFFMSIIFIYAFRLPKRISDIRLKWKEQKKFGEEHDQEVNYCHAMENVMEDVGTILFMGVVVNAIMLFG